MRTFSGVQKTIILFILLEKVYFSYVGLKGRYKNEKVSHYK